MARSFRELDAVLGGYLTKARLAGISGVRVIDSLKLSTSFDEAKAGIDALIWLHGVVKKGRPDAQVACAG